MGGHIRGFDSVSGLGIFEVLPSPSWGIWVLEFGVMNFCGVSCIPFVNGWIERSTTIVALSLEIDKLNHMELWPYLWKSTQCFPIFPLLCIVVPFHSHLHCILFILHFILLFISYHFISFYHSYHRICISLQCT